MELCGEFGDHLCCGAGDDHGGAGGVECERIAGGVPFFNFIQQNCRPSPESGGDYSQPAPELEGTGRAVGITYELANSCVSSTRCPAPRSPHPTLRSTSFR